MAANEDTEEQYVAFDEEEEIKPAKKPIKEGGAISLHTTSFKDFLLRDELKNRITTFGFEHPSEVQQECLPSSLIGMDILCQAKAGMGKTAVFILTILNRFLEATLKGENAVLVLAHTRELAFQISKEFVNFSEGLNIKTMLIIGGENVQDQKNKLKNERPNILIGTPGRVLALTKQKDLNLDNVQVFVIDECDKMLSALDMRADVQKIFKKTPFKKQVMMFSATLPPEIRDVCRKYMREPREILVDEENKLTLEGLHQFYVKLEEKEKNKTLNDILDKIQFNQVIIFVKNIKRCKELNKLLNQCNFPSIAIHGDLPQEERISLFTQFKECKKRLMVATDIFGRGIDIIKVNTVVNYDMPEKADDYMHRVGRAGRFGGKGITITFIAGKEDQDVFDEIQKRFVIKAEVLPDVIDPSTYHELIHVKIWHIAGKEKYITLPEKFYRNPDGVIIVYNVTDKSSFEKEQSG